MDWRLAILPWFSRVLFGCFVQIKNAWENDRLLAPSKRKCRYCFKRKCGLYISKYLYHSGYKRTAWKVVFHDRFKGEITDLPADVRVELLAHLVLLREKGLRLGRPEVDTLEGSRHANMKELRVKVLKVQWRFAFAFDPERKAVVLCGAAKSGVSQKLFYKRLIDLADKRYAEHLSELEKKHG
ncbi:type II toxin-antitoxin system RelE/ParE family toxin [Sinorhizobium meliloti]|uniref:type II toxin-antitoxin system RelE/ParE family toxin n=1 Tax=Rhizobium meliloti TaxID=382 RepID=UPI003B58AFD3